MHGPLERALWRVLRALLPDDEREDFLADLVEEAEARRARGGAPAARSWRRRQLWASIPPSLARRARSWMRATRDDARQAARALRGGRGTSVLFVATLGTGLGIATTVYGVLHAVLLAPLPYPEADELHVVRTVQPLRSVEPRGVSGPDFLDFSEALGERPRLGAFLSGAATLIGGGLRPTRVTAAEASRVALEDSGAEPRLGRLFSPEEDGPEPSRVALISERLWRGPLGADPAVIGRSISLDGAPHTVIGVLPAWYTLPEAEVAVWTPFGDGATGLHRRAPILTVLFRSDPTGVARVETVLGGVADRLAARYPETNVGREVRVEPLASVLAGPDGRALATLMIAALCLLAVSFLNAIGLLVSRAVQRADELRLRTALGAPRERIARQLRLEMATLTCVSLTAGLATAWVGVSVARGLWPPDTFRVDAIPLQPPVLVFAAVVAGLLIVLGPAVPALRWIPGSLDMGRATGGSRHMRTRLTLLAAQLATVLALLGSSVILLRGLGTTSATDRGIDIDGLLIGRVDLPQERYPTGMARYPEWPEVHRFHAALLEQLAREGEVRSVALAGSDPLSRPGFRMGVGLRTRDRADTVEAALQMVSPEWRSVVGLRLLAGRDLSARDGRAAEPVALVNDAFRRAYLSAADDWSGRITYLGAERRIVGVIEDVKPAPGAAPVATVLAPLAQTPSEMVTAVVRTRGVPATAVGVIRDAVYSVDPQLAVYAERPLASVLRESFTRPRLHGALVTAFGSAGLLLVAMGLFGLVSQIVSATRTSLGIRIALGAGRLHVVRAVLKGVSPPVLVGLVVGASGAAAAAPWVARLVPDTPAIDLVGLAAAVGVLLAAGALATLPPLLAALRTDPMRSLRPD